MLNSFQQYSWAELVVWVYMFHEALCKKKKPEHTIISCRYKTHVLYKFEMMLYNCIGQKKRKTWKKCFKVWKFTCISYRHIIREGWSVGSPDSPPIASHRYDILLVIYINRIVRTWNPHECIKCFQPQTTINMIFSMTYYLELCNYAIILYCASHF